MRDAGRLSNRDALLNQAERFDDPSFFEHPHQDVHGDLLRCWTWLYLSKLIGTDLTRNAHDAINEDGSNCDDDVGGPAYVEGRDGVDLEPLVPVQDTTARLATQKLSEQIERKPRKDC